MKKFNFFLLALLAMAVISVGCNNEDPIDDVVEPVGPTADLMAGTEPVSGQAYVTDSATVEPGEVFVVNLTADNGNSPLTRIEVLENGAAVDPSRVIFDGDSAQSNPNPLGDISALDWEIAIAAQDGEGTSVYDITVSDSNALDVTVTVTITTVVPSPPVRSATMYLLSNQGGPAGQGGLDVDTGEETGTTTGNFAAADIRDQGIDTSLPTAENWIQKIAPINGTTLKAAAGTIVWEDIETVEDLMVAFDNAAEISESDKVATGDIFFVVTTEGKTFGLVVTDIEVTPSDNSDFYEFDVKFE